MDRSIASNVIWQGLLHPHCGFTAKELNTNLEYMQMQLHKQKQWQLQHSAALTWLFSGRIHLHIVFLQLKN